MQYHKKLSVFRAILFGYGYGLMRILFFIRIMCLWVFTLILGLVVVVGSVFTTLAVTQYFGGERIRIRDLRAVWRLISACADTGIKCMEEGRSFLNLIWTRHFLLIVAALVAFAMVIYISIVFVLAYRRAALDIRDHGYSTVRRFISCFYLMPKIIIGALLYTFVVGIILSPMLVIKWFKYGAILDVDLYYYWQPWEQYCALGLAVIAFFVTLRLQFFLYRIVDTETYPLHALRDSFDMTQGSMIRLAILRIFFSSLNLGLFSAYWHIDTIAGTWLVMYPLFLLPAQRLAYAYAYRNLLAHKELPVRMLPKRGPLH